LCAALQNANAIHFSEAQLMSLPFTIRAKKAYEIAKSETMRLYHEAIDTEHLLLALLLDGTGVAITAIKNLGADLSRIESELRLRMPPDVECVYMGLAQTMAVKRVVDYAIDEARLFGHDYCGTEHLLLGLFREANGVAAEVLTQFGLSYNQVRSEIVTILRAENDRANGFPLKSRFK
jgi:ATP-dependent Clp protease ATP-binding subunit ClpC